MFIGLGRMELMFSGKMNRIRTRFCFLLVLLFSCFSSYAQEKCSILGYVHEFVKTPLSNDNVSVAVTSFEAILITKQDTLSTMEISFSGILIRVRLNSTSSKRVTSLLKAILP